MRSSQDPGSALVAIYSHSDSDAPEHFVASGVFIAPGIVLTARHAVAAVAAPRTLWVRAKAKSSPALPMAEVPRLHPALDAAWFRIDAMPNGASWLEMDLAQAPPRGSEAFRLFGYFRGLERLDSPRSLHDFDPDARWYQIEPAHAEGLSGAPLCLHNRLWAIAVQRSADAMPHSGFAIAMHQLWHGFLEHVPRPDPCQVPPTPPEASCVPDPVLAQLHTVMRRLFSQPALSTWAWRGPMHDNGLPSRCAGLFEAEPRVLGERLLRLLADEVLGALHESFDQGELAVDCGAAKRLRLLLSEAIGLAAKLCMDPAHRQGLERMVGLIDLPASQKTSATLALRKNPLASLVPVPDKGNRITRDIYAVSYGLEGGAGQDQRMSLASVIASIRSSRNLTGIAVDIRTEDELAEWRTFLLEERDQNRGRYLLLGKREATQLQELLSWLESFGVRVVRLTSEEQGLFWFEEDKLVGKVNRVLDDFQTHPMWKDTHDSA